MSLSEIRSQKVKMIYTGVCVWTHACARVEKEREREKGERGEPGEGKALPPIENFF